MTTAPIFETIEFTVDNGVGVLKLNRPESMNAMNAQLCKDIHGGLRAVAADKSIRALLITGNGRAFCAGADQKPGAALPPPNDASQLMRDYLNPVYELLNELDVPKIAAVNGAAAGAGMSLALNCDIVFAGRSAYFLAAFVNQALVADTGASWWLANGVGVPRANGVLMLNERLPAEKAADWGLIWRCVEDADLMPQAMAAAVQLAQGPTVALGLTARLTRNAVRNSVLEQMRLETEYQNITRYTQDRQEARQAFAARRAPDFQGR